MSDNSIKTETSVDAYFSSVSVLSNGKHECGILIIIYGYAAITLEASMLYNPYGIVGIYI